MSDILFVGPRVYEHRQSTLGGATVLFEILVADAARFKRQIPLTSLIISTNRYRSRLLSLMYVTTKTLLKAPRARVVLLNANQAGVTVLWPLFAIICRVFRLKLVLRCFGADFDKSVLKLGPLQTWLFKGTAEIYVETKNLLSTLEGRHKRLKWLPNSRTPSANKNKTRSVYSRKFIFLGRVTATKGIQELIQVFENLGSPFELSIFGPVDPDLGHLLNHQFYKGVLKPEHVESQLDCHDVLILPTYYPGEGYPGVIIEAFRHGLPVIGSFWGGIPEMVEDGITGHLIQPRSNSAIQQAVLAITDETWNHMSNNCMREFDKYNSTRNHLQLFNNLRALCAE